MIDNNTDMRFMSNNFIETGYNTREISSIASGFFASDLTTPERSRTFKFGGRFTINASNNQIYVNGSPYSITIGEYQSPAALAANIELAIAATNVLVQWDETSGGKFIFSLAASPFTLSAATTTNAVWETIGIISGANLIAPFVSTDYRISADMPRWHWPNEVIKFDFGYQASIGFVGMIGDLTRELQIPQGATITFQANNVDDFTAPPVNKVMTWTKRGVFAFIDDVVDSAWRYCRIILQHPEGPIHSEIGYLYIGDYSSFTDRNISTGFEERFVDTSKVSESDDGQLFTNQKTPYRVLTGISVGLANPANVNFLKRLFYLKLKAAPFFVALDPKVRISETIDDLTIFCRFTQEPQNQQVLFNKFELKFELTEAL